MYAEATGEAFADAKATAKAELDVLLRRNGYYFADARPAMRWEVWVGGGWAKLPAAVEEAYVDGANFLAGTHNGGEPLEVDIPKRSALVWGTLRRIRRVPNRAFAGSVTFRESDRTRSAAAALSAWVRAPKTQFHRTGLGNSLEFMDLHSQSEK